jgi:16S rRNA pseudouridine516 synthase
LRLDKYISNATDLSRSTVKRFIKAAQITVDEDIAVTGAQQVSPEQVVAIEGSPIECPSKRYFMMNKPLGVSLPTRIN